MRIEMDDNSALVTIGIAILVTVCVISIGITSVVNNTTRTAFATGYVEKQAVGNQSTYWTKP